MADIKLLSEVCFDCLGETFEGRIVAVEYQPNGAWYVLEAKAGGTSDRRGHFTLTAIVSNIEMDTDDPLIERHLVARCVNRVEVIETQSDESMRRDFEALLRGHEQVEYRRGRRAGYGGGLRAGINNF